MEQANFTPPVVETKLKVVTHGQDTQLLATACAHIGSCCRYLVPWMHRKRPPLLQV